MCVDSHPKGVTVQRSHHGHEEGLLEQGEESADQGLHACQTAELGGRVPAGVKQPVSHGEFCCCCFHKEATLG